MSSIAKFGFGVGDADAPSEVWGGKGAGLMRMAAEGLPVPPGFTITTEACSVYQKHPDALMDAIMKEVGEYLDWLKEGFGYMPLLSVRSGARVSMPGMMDTILNVGISKGKVEKEWAERLNPQAAADCYRRLLEMIGTTALGLDKKAFDQITAAYPDDKGKQIAAFEALYKGADLPLPGNLEDQLRCSIEAVFKSWNSPRAIEYRKLENIPNEWGTAVTVQAMVFGNMNDKSGSGVLFSRNPSTGEPGLFGEFLPNAQGEDVVAGTHTPMKVEEMHKLPGWGSMYAELTAIAHQLETTRKDMQDMEFTVQDGKLFMLQTRSGKRSAQAAFRIATDMVAEGLIDFQTAVSRISPKQFKVVKRPQIDPKFKDAPALTGIPGSMGIAVGRVVFSSEQAVAEAANGPVILVTHETTPDDIAGMAASVGILTQTGGATSHAAVVARGMDKPCVVGCTDLILDDNAQFKVGDMISIDGASGRVWVGEIPLINAMEDGVVGEFLDRLMQSKGLIEQTAIPTACSVTAVADWISLPDDEIMTNMAGVKAVLQTGEWLLLDTTFKASAEDQMIWGIGGGSPEQAKLDRIVKKLAALDLDGAFVSGDDASVKLLVKAGAQEVPSVSTIAELRAAKGMVRVGWQLLQTIGGADDQNALFDLLRVHGGMTAKIMSAPVTKNYAAFTMLGAAA